MACRISELALDCRDPQAQARWWAEVLGWQVLEEDDDGCVEIGPGDELPAVPNLLFVPVPEAKTCKLPLHIDVSPTDTTQEDELQRLLALGARPASVGQEDAPDGAVTWHVLQDPEGNEFCLLRSPKPL